MFANRFGAGFLKAYDLLENGDRSYLQNVAMLDRMDVTQQEIVLFHNKDNDMKGLR